MERAPRPSCSAKTRRVGWLRTTCRHGLSAMTASPPCLRAGPARRGELARRSNDDADGVLVPHARDRRRRVAAAHGSGRAGRLELSPLAQRSPPAFPRRRPAPQRDAARDRVRLRARRDDGRRRLCTNRARRRIDPVPLALPPVLAWSRNRCVRPAAGACHYEPAPRADRLSLLARGALARLCILASSALALVRHGNRRQAWLDGLRRFRLLCARRGSSAVASRTQRRNTRLQGGRRRPGPRAPDRDLRLVPRRPAATRLGGESRNSRVAAPASTRSGAERRRLANLAP